MSPMPIRVAPKKASLMPVTEIGDPRLQALFGANDPRETGVRPTVRLAAAGAFRLPCSRRSRSFSACCCSWSSMTPAHGSRARAVRRRLRSRRRLPGRAAAALRPACGRAGGGTARSESRSRRRRPLPAPGAALAAPARRADRLCPAASAADVAARARTRSRAVVARVRRSWSTPAARRGGSGGRAAARRRLTAERSRRRRMRASALANRSTTDHPGDAHPGRPRDRVRFDPAGLCPGGRLARRALVRRTNVLIPRGSKLIGEYRSDVRPGPEARGDHLDPADPPRRHDDRDGFAGGRHARPRRRPRAVNTPFLRPLRRCAAAVDRRTSEAHLRSASVDGPVCRASGRAQRAAGQIAPAEQIYVPTLTVPAGKSISVFVAHDLDFSAAGRERASARPRSMRQRASIFALALRRLTSVLSRPDVTDIYVNRPGELWIETLGGAIERHEKPEITELTLARLARQIAALTHQGVSREHPLLAADPARRRADPGCGAASDAGADGAGDPAQVAAS